MPKTDFQVFTREQLEALAKSAAMTNLIGAMFIGLIGEQQARWLPDGSIEVLTEHNPS